MKKFFYGFIIFVVSLMLIIVIAANSSYVIKKAADAFAPEYHISYQDITGNIFTGVKIDGLKFKDMEISKQIKFSWNPSKILYKRIAVSEIRGENIDVDAVKALINSFPSSDDNTSSEPFPLVVTVGKVYISVNPFVEQNISVEKTVLEAEDILYASDEIEVGDLKLKLDTNITKLQLHASLEDGKVTVRNLAIDEIDTEAIASQFLSGENDKEEKVTQDEPKKEKSDAINPLIPQKAVVEHFSASVKPRDYLDATIDKLTLTADDLAADIVKIMKNEENALEVGDLVIVLKSNIGQLDLQAGLKNEIVYLEKLNVTRVDTMALKSMFVPDSNESNGTADANVTSVAEKEAEVETKSEEEPNHLIPQKVVLGSLHADILPATFNPVHILSFVLNASDVTFDVEKLLVEKGKVDFNGTTNLSNIYQQATITDNHLDGHIVLTPNKPLFDMYAPTIRKEAIGDIDLDFSASKEKVTVDLSAKAKHLLLVQADTNITDANLTDVNQSEKNAAKPFNVDINHLKTRVVYLIESGKVNADTDISVTTPLSKEVTLLNHFEMEEGKLHYAGDLKAGEVKLPDGKVIPPLDHLHIAYSGNEKRVKTDISSRALKGYFNVADFKGKGRFHLETKEALEAGKVVSLPAELNATKINAVIDIPLNFAKLVPINGTAKITSNVANLDADLVYGDTVKLDLLATIPTNSLLKNFDKNIQWSAISPLKANMKMGEKEIFATLRSSKIFADMAMQPFDGTVKGKIKLAGLLTTLKGKAGGDIVIKSNVDSFNTLLGTVTQFYHLEELPKVDGKLDMTLTVKPNSDAVLQLTSPKIIYHADRKTAHDIDDVKITLSKRKDTLTLRSYQLTYNKMTFFATKPSVVAFKDQSVSIEQLWLNDELKVSGELNPKTMQGEIVAQAEKFHFSHEMIDLDSKIDITARFNGENTDVKGKVTLLGGDIHYDLSTKTFPSDSDILIVQEMKKKEPSSFMEHLTLDIKVDTEKPLVYREGPVNVKAKVDLSINKAVYSDPMVLGSIDLVDGSSYTFQGKKFILERSHIYLTGDPSKPMLDITVKYQALRHLITISVTGTPAVPNILFSSVPSLTKEQILSIILFDSEEGAATNDANDMMKMMGGAMAKSALNDLGVKIDHLVIGEGNSVEVGKKLTDKITVIYINGEIPKMQMKYEYSPSIEIVVGASEESESLDVVYIKDFNMRQDDDIVIKGR